MDFLKLQSVILEENIIGNFKVGVGNKNTCYTQEWNFEKDNFIHLQSNETGDELHCISLENHIENTQISIWCKFLFDSQMQCEIKTFIENADFYIFSYDGENNCIWESFENIVSDNVDENNFLKFEITAKNIKKGDCIFTIKFNCTTKQTKQTKMSLQDFTKNIFQPNNYNLQ